MTVKFRFSFKNFFNFSNKFNGEIDLLNAHAILRHRPTWKMTLTKTYKLWMHPGLKRLGIANKMPLIMPNKRICHSVPNNTQ